jgi:Pectin methylesterase
MRRFFILFLVVMAGVAVRAQKYDFVVAQDGSGNFTTIQAAVDASKAFPDAPITIFIKNGVYKEKVNVAACNSHLRLIGESVDKTILTYGDYFDKIGRGRNSTFYTYTLMVEADDFRAENLTIENSAGPVGQAVALHVEGDRCAFVNCRLLGNQDTVYLSGQTSRDYFSNCYIEGTTDFIFGAATAYFDQCTLHIKVNSYVTAASTNQGKRYGFVFNECKLTAAEGVNKAYLGRPWRDYARVVYIHCNIGKHIAPAGWVNWDKTSRDKTAYYAEFENSGEGAATSQRVAWSHQLTKKEVIEYTKEKVLAATLPSSEPVVDEWAK